MMGVYRSTCRRSLVVKFRRYLATMLLTKFGHTGKMHGLHISRRGVKVAQVFIMGRTRPGFGPIDWALKFTTYRFVGRLASSMLAGHVNVLCYHSLRCTPEYFSAHATVCKVDQMIGTVRSQTHLIVSLDVM